MTKKQLATAIVEARIAKGCPLGGTKEGTIMAIARLIKKEHLERIYREEVQK